MNFLISLLLGRAAAYYAQGDYERAVRQYTSDIERVPDHPDYYLARAACLLNLMQKERALADVERALKITPNYAIAIELRGEIFLLGRYYGPALENFNRAQELNPRWSVPHFDRAVVMLQQKAYRAAIDEFNIAFKLPFRMPLYYIVRSQVHFRLGDFKSAHADQDAALRRSKQESLVMTEVNQEVYDDYLDWAEDFYGRVLARRPRLAYAWQGRADAYLRNGDNLRAIADYTRAIELNPREALTYLGRGKALQADGQTGAAISDFRRVPEVTEFLHLRRQAEERLKIFQGGNPQS